MQQSKCRLIPQEFGALKRNRCEKGDVAMQLKKTLNGVHFESCIVPRQKKFFMLVDTNVLKETGVSTGDVVSASVRLTAD